LTNELTRSYLFFKPFTLSGSETNFIGDVTFCFTTLVLRFSVD
jgi:hypothetical protein